MDSNKISTAKSVSLISWIFKIISFPFAIGSFIYTFLMSKNLKNCLPGKVVLITGASSGLGEALAHTFYVAGCKVVLAARRQEELERVRKDLLQLHSVSQRNIRKLDIDLNAYLFYLFRLRQPIHRLSFHLISLTLTLCLIKLNKFMRFTDTLIF